VDRSVYMACVTSSQNRPSCDTPKLAQDSMASAVARCLTAKCPAECSAN
jgi:hypothetical protein